MGTVPDRQSDAQLRTCPPSKTADMSMNRTQPTAASDSAHVLLIDGPDTLREIRLGELRDSGLASCRAETSPEEIAALQHTDAAVAILDLSASAPGKPAQSDDARRIRAVLTARPETAVVVLMPDDSARRAVAAMRAGAFDVLTAPVADSLLVEAIEAACAAATRRTRATTPLNRPEPTRPVLVRESQLMRQVCDRIDLAAQTDAPVLITGESGTGKELCAQTIHALGPRASGPFVVLDCASIQAERFESELFGHFRGAFSGAVTDRPGLATLADGGTLFLDEICELPAAAQPKLLRFLQSLQVQPVGSIDSHPVDLRVIAASTIPPLEAVADGRLRDELFYRLQVVSIRMPSLRERPEDIVPLATELLRRAARLENRAFRSIAPHAATVLQAQPWPGNVRQLTSVMRAITVLHDGPELKPEMLPDDMHNLVTGNNFKDPSKALAGMTLAEIERRVIKATLERHHGSVPKAARELSVAPSTLYRKIDSWTPED